MRRKLYFTSLLILLAASLYAQYIPDVLGDGYLRRTFQMPDDYEGKVVCTLVKKPQLPDVKQAVLYIHGYNDYFFQKQLGDSVNAHGYNFYPSSPTRIRFSAKASRSISQISIRHWQPYIRKGMTGSC